MAKDTAIQWSDSTVNPTMGCDGCEIWNLKRKSCYAGVLHGRFPNAKGYAPTFEEVTEFTGRMAEAAGWSDLAGEARKNKPWMNGLPRIIFVSDMSDSLSRSVKFDYLRDEIIANVASEKGQRHIWMWLTKRPERMSDFSSWLAGQGREWPDNLWAGTSITTQATASRINSLLKVGTPRTIRFVSVEPQIESINLEAWLPNLDLVIQGGESGQRARPFDTYWAEEIIDQCRSHGTSYFLKQLGSIPFNGNWQLSFKDGHGGDWSEWDEKLRIREFPTSKLENNHA